jgi:hypothetical protein
VHVDPRIAENTTTRRSIAGWCVGALWLAVVLTGFGIVVDFDMTPGEAGIVPQQRPADVSLLASVANRPLLMLFAHPRCPCTRATLAELNRLVTASPGALEVKVFFRTPENPSEEWTKTALREAAAAIPNTTVTCDPGGALARKFDVKTSGHLLVYSADGQLLFSGGITSARNEEGVNAGRSAVEALLKGQAPVARESPVFGCPLFDSSTVTSIEK